MVSTRTHHHCYPIPLATTVTVYTIKNFFLRRSRRTLPCGSEYRVYPQNLRSFYLNFCRVETKDIEPMETHTHIVVRRSDRVNKEGNSSFLTDRDLQSLPLRFSVFYLCLVYINTCTRDLGLTYPSLELRNPNTETCSINWKDTKPKYWIFYFFYDHDRSIHTTLNKCTSRIL